jgi:hypothetical protein
MYIFRDYTETFAENAVILKPTFRSTEVEKGERGSRGEMQRLRAKPKVPVGGRGGEGGTLGISSQGVGNLSSPAHY